ncbi:MAG TPA: hypothetical protein VJ770_29455 [Stellaceae bacterium]|nr:hypothetical protein [Stellaceae bacterium]
MSRTIKDGLDDEPTAEDFAKIEASEGPCPADADDAERGRRWRLVQAAQLIRLYEQGRLPVNLMRHLDKLRQK